MTARKGQIWINKQNGMRLVVAGTKGGMLKAKILTEKPGVYAGSHTLSPQLLKRRYSLYEKSPS